MTTAKKSETEDKTPKAAATKAHKDDTVNWSDYPENGDQIRSEKDTKEAESRPAS